jgi:hypothetical protein
VPLRPTVVDYQHARCGSGLRRPVVPGLDAGKQSLSPLSAGCTLAMAGLTLDET